MKKIIVLGFLMSMGVAYALPGGTYHYCNGSKWESAGTRGGSLGKTCVHCDSGRHVRLYVRLPRGGGYKYYTVNKRYVGSSVSQAIRNICR